MTAGVITVAGDGTYSAVPTLGPFGNPATATSMAQAIFELIFPPIVAIMPASEQAKVVDATTSPPTTIKGRTMKSLAATLANPIAAAVVGYVQANAVAHVTSQSLGQTPNPNNASTPIVAPGSPVNIPIQ